MTNEEKSLLLRDLCGRLPYGVKINCFYIPRKLLGISVDDDGFVALEVGGEHFYYPCNNVLHDECLPYLRPMSSMTEEEEIEMTQILEEVYDSSFTMDKLVEDVRMQEYIPSKYVDWLNKHHFDYRGLIKKGLALEAPQDMYNNN